MASEQPVSPTTRPRGILKNPSFSGPSSTSPPPPPTTIEDDELTKQNTLQNAGRRRSSSANLLRSGRARSSTPGHSHSNSLSNGTSNGEDTEGRLKWDEANLYLTEQDRGQSMKITEPKTPYAPSYDPATDAEEMKRLELDAKDLDVDELDLALKRQKKRGDSLSEVPDLDIGSPQEDLVTDMSDGGESMSRSSSTRSKARVVAPQGELGLTKEAEERHRRFEEKRKMHYEMKDVKGLLTHVSDDEDEDEDEEMPDAHDGTNGVRS